MPPKKRSGSTSTAASAQSKKSKTESFPEVEWAGILKNSKRWATVSGSRNVDAEYKYTKNKDGEDKAYEYICVCNLPWQGNSDEEEDDDEEDDSEEEEDEDEDEDEASDDPDQAGGKTKKPKCDAGETCLCYKPAAEHPEHRWIITKAGLHKFLAQRVMTDLRCPYMFNMDIYNDFHGYGVLEVFENLLLDYAEADGDWKEQWVVCETIVWFLLDPCSEEMMRIDDGDRLDATIELAGRVFLSMLTTLESKKLLSETSEVKDLGLVMALYMQVARQLRKDLGILEGHEKVSHFDDWVLAYANEYAIPLVGPKNIDAIAAERDGTVKLLTATDAKPDPWGSKAAIKKHEKEYGTSSHSPMVASKGRKACIGGDKHDITAFSSAERKENSFTKKDVLGPKQIEALKLGLVLRPA